MDNLLTKLISIRDYYQIQVDDFNIEIPWGKPDVILNELEDLIKKLTPEKETFVLYPATLLESSEGVSLTFKDFPNVTVESSTIDDLLFQASMSLSFSIQGLIESGLDRTNPSKINHGDIAIYYHIGGI